MPAEDDPAISAFLEFWQQQRVPSRAEKERLGAGGRGLVKQWDRIVQKEGLLYWSSWRPDGGEEVFQFLLPESLKSDVLQEHHHHQGIERTTDVVKQRCFWPGMDKDVKDWCQQCQRCVLAKSTQSRAFAPMGHLQASRPNQLLAIDFTFLEPARDGRELVMVMTDVFSKFTQAIPTHDQKAATVAKVLPVRSASLYPF